MGTIPALNKQGLVADVVGTGALIHTQQTTANLKVRLRSVVPRFRATYSLGIWNNLQDFQSADLSDVDSTRRADIRRRRRSFASNEYTWNQTQMSNAVSLKSDTKRSLRFRHFASSYNYLQEISSARSPTATGVGFSERQDHPQRRHECRTPTPRASGGPSVRWAAGNQLRHSRRPLLSSQPILRRRRSGTDAVDRHRPALFRRHRRNAHRRAVAARRLEDRSECETDARRSARDLAGLRRLQLELRDSSSRRRR